MLPQEWVASLNSMQKNALIRWVKSGKSYAIFYGFSPLGKTKKTPDGKKYSEKRPKAEILFPSFLRDLYQKSQSNLDSGEVNVFTDAIKILEQPIPQMDDDVEDYEDDDDETIACPNGFCNKGGKKTLKKGKKGKKVRKTRKVKKTKKVKKESKNKTRRSKK
jgi:hypothetical protein